VSAYEPYPYSRTYLVFRQRTEGVWNLMGEETVFANHPIRDPENGELVVRAFLSRTGNVGGEFAIVPKEVWERINGQRGEAVASRAVAA
jgi:hypothetical protein